MIRCQNGVEGVYNWTKVDERFETLLDAHCECEVSLGHTNRDGLWR